MQVNWPFSMKIYREIPERDERARNRYETLRNRYLNVQSDEEIAKLAMDPTISNFGMTGDQSDCLAISRDFFCATEFPKCESFEIPESPMCGFSCQLWLDRCPDVSEQTADSARKRKITCHFVRKQVQARCVHLQQACVIRWRLFYFY
jgi:hypothetical protein